QSPPSSGRRQGDGLLPLGWEAVLPCGVFVAELLLGFHGTVLLALFMALGQSVESLDLAAFVQPVILADLGLTLRELQHFASLVDGFIETVEKTAVVLPL